MHIIPRYLPPRFPFLTPLTQVRILAHRILLFLTLQTASVSSMLVVYRIKAHPRKRVSKPVHVDHTQNNINFLTYHQDDSDTGWF